jgi:Skp family chaperone for outer membrane proteins
MARSMSLKHLVVVLGVVCAAQFAVILLLLLPSSRVVASTGVPNKMIDVGRAIAVHQEQKQHMTKLVDHSRATSDMIKESCFKARAKDRKLLEDVLQENAELREGRFLERDKRASSSAKKHNASNVAGES